MNSDITVVLVGPESDGNIGAVCRSMKNFNIRKLILVDPKAPLDYETLRPYSMHGYDIYEQSEKKSDLEFLKDYDLTIAFTGKSDPKAKILRQPVPLKSLSSMITGKTALVFGRESRGLTNDEIALCSATSTIPASLEYPILNLSHAVTIVLYELFGKKYESIPDPMKAHTRNTLIDAYDSLVDTGSFKNPEVVKLAFSRMVSRAGLTEKEAKAVLALFSKILRNQNQMNQIHVRGSK